MILQEEHGVSPADIVWVRGAYEQPTGRPEKIALNLPPNVRIEPAPPNTTISGLLASGEIGALIGPRIPSCFEQGHPQVSWLYPDPTAAAADWFRKRRIFPIMHLVGMRRALASQHAWLPAAACKAFEQAKAIALRKLADTTVTKVTLPFVEEQLRASRNLMGRDFWSYGFRENRLVLETFLRYHHAEGLSSRLLTPEELFPPSTIESHVI